MRSDFKRHLLLSLFFVYFFPILTFNAKWFTSLWGFFKEKKSFYIIRLFSNIWGHYLTFFSNSKLLFFVDYYYTQELHVFLKILLFLFFSIDDCSRDRFRYVLPEYPKPRRKTPTFLVPEPDSNMSRWRWVCELNMNPTFGFVL